MTTFVRYCPSCPCADECKDKFSGMWPGKSAGGVGCNHPVDGKGAIIPPPPAVDDSHIVEWVEEYVRRKAVARERFKHWTPRELDLAVCRKYPGRFNRRYS